MARFKLTIEYDGTRYSGWQMQKGGKSVMGEIMDASRELFGTEDLEIYGAGRTDAGVHALAQVAHLDVKTNLVPLRIKYGINDRLPPDISILNVEETDSKFHARHDAAARSYIYQISQRRTAFGKKYVWWIKDILDYRRMEEAAALFIGLHDYISFTDPEHEQNSTKVRILHAGVKCYNDMIIIHIIGSHFLWKQVRRMTGVLVETGRGNLSSDDVSAWLRSRSDAPAKLTAPPSGLFLEKVYYRGEKFVTDVMPVVRL